LTLENITEKKKIEEGLKKEQIRANLYLDLAGVIIVALNKNGEITLLNKKGYEVLEYNDGELFGKNWFDTCLPSRFKDQVFEVFNQLMRGEVEPVEFYENPVITKNGKEKIIAWHNALSYDESKNVIGTLSSGEDITERKVAEEELKKNEEFLQNIFDGMQDGLSILDKDLNIIRVNYWMQEMYDREEGLIGKKCYEIYQRREAPCPWCPSLITLDSGQKHTSIVPYPSEENPTGWIELTSFPLKQQDNKVIGVIEYVKNITERVNANQKLKESEEKYRSAYNRSNLYKDVFTHDINNILQNILSSIELTKIFSSDPKRRQSFEEVTNLIYEQVIRGKMLVSNVQELSKTDEITSSLFSIEALKVLKDSLESVKSQFTQKVIDIKIDSLQDNYFVKANELLKDVFVNILTNAIQHNTNPFIEISIRISKENYKGIQFIKFEFLDNGIGIPDSMKQLIFGREYKKEGIPSGIGLGLLLVKRILEFYKGEIRVEDRIKGNFTEGSNFIITIPEAI